VEFFAYFYIITISEIFGDVNRNEVATFYKFIAKLGRIGMLLKVVCWGGEGTLTKSLDKKQQAV
jgi:hypothetical protein